MTCGCEEHGAHTSKGIPGRGIFRAANVGPANERVVLELDLLAKNNAFAAENRARLSDRNVLMLNLVSSPGSGKTTLLVRTLQELAGTVPLAVIEGDQQTRLDADRISATGVPVIQINTGKGCHLDAHQIERAIADLAPAPGSVLFVENVGNLVCPAAFDLGESCKVVMLSVTEGEDKPLKYPDMFLAAQLLILTKIDLLPYVSFSVERAIEYARRINPRIEVLSVSATVGTGMNGWLSWLRDAQANRSAVRRPAVDAGVITA
jgi:hydrogenase nickel incorporation protein HypB